MMILKHTAIVIQRVFLKSTKDKQPETTQKDGGGRYEQICLGAKI